MLRALLYLWENYGLDALQLGVICFFGWKILTNHFKHLQDDITTIKNKLESFEENTTKIRERVAKLEGQIE